MSASQHTAVVERLAADLSRVLDPAGKYTVRVRPRCQLLDGFPTCITTFDVAVLAADSHWSITANGPVLDPGDAPRVGINVVTAETLEAATIRTPNVLGRTAVSEYVLFDPSGAVLRPSFQTFWKTDGVLNRSWPGIKGVFFSGLGFRLDVRGGSLSVSGCGCRSTEEELFVLRCERDSMRAAARGGPAERDARIARLESRLLERPRSREGGA